MKHTLVALVENKPGVLNRVVSLFRRRNFNIEQPHGRARPSNPDVSRMTIVVDADRTSTAQVEKNLYKLISVLDVRGRDQRADGDARPGPDQGGRQQPDAHRHHAVHRRLPGRVVDVSPDTLVIEISGDEDKISAFVDLMRPFRIKEMVRTGGRGHGARQRARGPAGRAGRLARPDSKHYQEENRGKGVLRPGRGPGASQRQDRRDHRLRQPGPRPRPQPARQRHATSSSGSTRAASRGRRPRTEGLTVMTVAEATAARRHRS